MKMDFTNIVVKSKQTPFYFLVVSSCLFLIFLSGCLSGKIEIVPGDTEQVEVKKELPVKDTSFDDIGSLDLELFFSSDEIQVVSGDSVELRWQGRNFDTCSADGDWSGDKYTEGAESIGPLKIDSTYVLKCLGAYGEVSRSVSISVLPGPPLVKLRAAQQSVIFGSEIELRWTALNADTCVASGAWSGDYAQPQSGVEYVTPSVGSNIFTLTCTNIYGSRSDNLEVVVTPAAPFLDFSANAYEVESGDSIELSWNVGGSSTCIASGDWLGSKLVSGSEDVGQLFEDSDFILTCVVSGGTLEKTLSVKVLTPPAPPIPPAPSTGSVLGNVDSSFISRFNSNKVYVFSEFVTPDDIDGDNGDPLLVVDVFQEEGACGFSYQVSDLAIGKYTLAFTSQAASDAVGIDDNILFDRVLNVDITNGESQLDIVADNIIRVGPNNVIKTIAAAAAIASEGDVIEIEAGEYPDDIIVWRTNNIVIRGIGGRAHVSGSYTIPYIANSDINNGMGLWVVKANQITIENMEFSNAKVDDGNGAGIRNEGTNLTICNGYFHDNQDGFLGGAYGTLLIEYSEFNHNGLDGLGLNHNMYIDDGDKFILRHSYSHHAVIGHNVKSRAKENHIFYNRIMDENDGNASYAIDLPNGGLTYIIGNLLQQGQLTDNSTMISYGAEGFTGDGRKNNLYIINNTLVNDYNSGAFMFINNAVGESKIINNIFSGGGSINGRGTMLNNLVSDSPALLDQSNFNYELTALSVARDGGVLPGSSEDGVSLTPLYQYVHPLGREVRSYDGSLDIGAYEFK